MGYLCFIGAVFRLNFIDSAALLEEQRWRGPTSISKFDHHNISGGAVDDTVTGILVSSIYSSHEISNELNPLPTAPLVLKFGIHQGQAGRKGVRGGEEEGWSAGGGG
jgi:hypothetical protein